MYKTTKDIIIPAGTEVGIGPTHSRYFTEHGDILVSFSKDSCGSLRFDLEEIIKLGLVEKK